MSDELFAEVKSEGEGLDIDKAFDRLATKGEEPSESRTEKEGEVPSEGDKTPVEPPKESKRWAEMRREIKEAKDVAASAIAETEALKKASQPQELPEWWKKTYGETDESKTNYRNYNTATEAERNRIKDEVKQDLQKETQAEVAQTQDAEEYVETQMAEMSEEGLKFEKNELLKFMVDFQEEFGPGSLLDAEGNYDFRKALALKGRLDPPEPEDNSQRKQLASQAGRSKVSAGNASKIPVVTTRMLRGRGGWRDANI